MHLTQHLVCHKGKQFLTVCGDFTLPMGSKEVNF